LIFLTVGSMFPFDRLIRSVDQMVADQRIGGPIVAQIGDGKYEPVNFEFKRFMDKPAYEAQLNAATLLIAHAGAGTISMALERGKPLLVVPRLSRNGEHVNDHQIATARKFEELEHVLVAYDMAEIPDKLHALKSFVPRRREVDAQRMARRIGLLLRSIG
jgi:UDP-N-acetylglucosamine transferase subunit ALG13